MKTQSVPTICYDLPTVSRFFRSVALAVAMQKYMSLEWKDYKDSTVLNVVYSVMFWKGPPGSVEVNTGSRQQIEAETNRLHAHYLMTWVDKVHGGGPGAGNSYTTQMMNVRESARSAIESTFRDAREINAEIARDTQEAIVALARIRLAATVGVAIIGAGAGIAFVSAAAAGSAGGAGLMIAGVEAGAGGFTFGATGAGFSMTNSLIKTWEGGAGAKVAAISMDSGKYAGGEAAGHVAGHGMTKALSDTSHSQQIIKSAEGQITKYSKVLEGKVKKKTAAKATNIIANSQAKVVSETARMGKSGQLLKGARALGTAAPVFFAAWDIMDALGDYNDTMAATGR